MKETKLIDEKAVLPEIIPIFNANSCSKRNDKYGQILTTTLEDILPKHLISRDNESQDFQSSFYDLLPYLTFKNEENFSRNLSFYLICKYRSNAFKFFYEMISRWLVPGKKLNVLLLYAVDFKIPSISDETFTLCEVILEVQKNEEYQTILKNLPFIESEIRLGVKSAYYARRILEIKGLSFDEKTAMVQENITIITQRLPKTFDRDVFSEMQFILIMCRDKFKSIRSARHLSRLISYQYIFRRNIQGSISRAPDKRHLGLKLFKSKLHQNSGNKEVLCILVVVNFLRDKEVFEKRHLLKAIQHYIHAARIVENSFMSFTRGTEPICTLYLEIEKSDGTSISTEEIRLLNRELPDDLKSRIEHLMHPLFMPRNEEEIMRNILQLSNQIKYLRDIPQVMISFDEQSHTHLFFTVIVVRVLKPGSLSIQERFQKTETCLEYINDRCKTVGVLRKKYTKEATVFWVKVVTDQFLRRDHSIDLYRARQTVAHELSKVLEDYRDFNGGMIMKQGELLEKVRELLGDKLKYYDLLLENFFYSLSPVVMRAVLDPHSVITLFQLLLDALENAHHQTKKDKLRIKSIPFAVHIMLSDADHSIRQKIDELILKVYGDSIQYARSFVNVYDVYYLGYICMCEDSQKQKVFIQGVQDIVDLNTLNIPSELGSLAPVCQ